MRSYTSRNFISYLRKYPQPFFHGGYRFAGAFQPRAALDKGFSLVAECHAVRVVRACRSVEDSPPCGCLNAV